MKYLPSIIILLALLTNCNSTSKVTAEKSNNTSKSDLTGTFNVTTIYGQDVSEHNLTMTFDNTNKTVSGYTGCNTYSCDYTMGNTITFGIPNASKRMCLENTGQVEKRFFKAMSETNNRKSNAATLELFNTDNKIITAEKKE